MRIYHLRAGEDKVLMFDLDLVEVVAKLRPLLRSVKTLVVLTGRDCMHKAVRRFHLSCCMPIDEPVLQGLSFQ
jgi:hypothetical protein